MNFAICAVCGARRTTRVRQRQHRLRKEGTEADLGHGVRPPVELPRLLAHLLARLEVAVNVARARVRRPKGGEREDVRSRVLPHVVHLVQPADLRVPRADGRHELLARLDPASPKQQHQQHRRRRQRRHDSRQPSTAERHPDKARRGATTYHVLSHSSSVPGFSWYVRSSKIPPRACGGAVGMNANSWLSCALRETRCGRSALYARSCCEPVRARADGQPGAKRRDEKSSRLEERDAPLTRGSSPTPCRSPRSSRTQEYGLQEASAAARAGGRGREAWGRSQNVSCSPMIVSQLPVSLIRSPASPRRPV